MKIAVEVGWSNKPGGARRVAFNGLRSMAVQAPANEYFLYSNTWQPDLPAEIAQKVLAVPSPVPSLLWDQFLFPHWAVSRQLAKDKPDVVLHTNNIVPLARRVPNVVVIHDMTPFILPKSFYRSHALYQQAYFRYAAKRADRIITVSQNSKEDICRILGTDPGKVVVAPLASDLAKKTKPADIRKLEKKFNLLRPYILFVGAIHPRKNVPALLRAFSLLKQSKRIPHQLVIAGARRWMPTDAGDKDLLNKLGDSVTFTGPVDDEELVSLYQNTDAFVYPSLYEGFGLPVLEAMSLGAPVVTSNVSSLPEVAGNAALTVDPRDIGQISDAMLRIIEQADLAERLRMQGYRRSAEFSWESHARIVLDTLEAAARA